ncbi:D-Ala-D-Ala carboxypeptidase family metallohydrolase [Paramuribaculum intestinale]|uniref:D-Ala-D-Ala carboxypeptidase family metallohydrolase n=1 Tax=Paramuribaculum intestinale TaxID=2094151 RepID=UPI000FFE6DC5|nr:D-Ala-D-Ala carboxypeptidase family metallohydrolase [Paramuribaculum intestinale]RXE61758.1 peptidase M15 [Muribaculaceae bacterium Isolate-004 (NCI)]
MKYFSFQEFERSETAYRHGIDNTAPESARKNIAVLVDKVLDPLREAWGKPISVTSGYRCSELNAKVPGASRTSQHMTGEAADISVGNQVDNRRLAQKILDLKLPFDQIINEHDWQWVHVSYRDGHNRHEMLKTVPGGYVKISAL